MKILRIIARLNVGGPARHVVWLTRALDDGDYKSCLVAGSVPPGEEDMGYFAAENGVTPEYIAELSRELSPKDLISLWKIYRSMRAFAPDIVHTHTAKAGTVGRVAAFLYKWFTWHTLLGRPRDVKVIHTFHGHVFHSYYGPLKTRIFIWIERLLALFATDLIVTISDQQFHEIHEQVGIGRFKQFRVVPLGIDLTQFDAAERSTLRNEIGAAEDEIVVGFMGRFTAIKNLPLMLRAAAAVHKIEPELAMRFVMIGDGELRSSLENVAADLGLSNTVVFMGNRTDVTELLPGLDIAILTSLNEGTPLSLIESMAAARTFVSTAVGGVVDLAGDRLEQLGDLRVCERGVLAETATADSIAHGLIYLAKNEKLRARLSENGREHVMTNYSTDRLICDLKEIYREVQAG